MKFTIFALIAVLCLTVNVSAFVQPLKHDEIGILPYHPQDSAEDVIDVETFSVFGPMKSVIKSALRTLKGVNCSIKGVMDMQAAALTFTDDISACGGQVSAQVQAVLNACKAVISTSNDIINLNSNVCNNGAWDEAADGNSQTSTSCFLKLIAKMITLKRQIGKSITLIKKVPQAPAQTSACVTTALNNLSTTFTQFPTFVKSCSQLTSN